MLCFPRGRAGPDQRLSRHLEDVFRALPPTIFGACPQHPALHLLEMCPHLKQEEIMFDLTPQAVSEFVERDDEVIGLGKRLRSTSAPRWIVQTRVDGRSRKRVLGDADAISLIGARLAAIKLLEKIKANQPEEVADAPNPLATVEEFAVRFLADRGGSVCLNSFEPFRPGRCHMSPRRCRQTVRSSPLPAVRCT